MVEAHSKVKRLDLHYLAIKRLINIYKVLTLFTQSILYRYYFFCMLLFTHQHNNTKENIPHFCCNENPLFWKAIWNISKEVKFWIIKTALNMF